MAKVSNLEAHRTSKMAKRRASSKASKSTKKSKSSKGSVTESAEEQQHARPEVYTTRPEQPKQKKEGQLSKQQLDDFFEKGFVILKDFVDTSILDEIRNNICEQVNDLAEKLYKAGKIKNKHEDKGLLDRLTYLEHEFPGTAVILHKSDYLPPAFQKLWGYDKLLNVVEQIIGPEISGHPVWNLRPKTPHNAQLTVPWHQDNAYFDPSALDTFLATAWIPFVDTHEKNGCMQMVTGGHKKGITATHTCCAGGTWYVDLAEDEMKKELGVDPATDAFTCEIPYGGVLLFNNCIPHRSLENFSDGIRWSIDLRWCKTGADSGSLGEGVVMRTAEDPNFQIDWKKAEQAKRNKNQERLTVGKQYDELEPVISGPWMRRWKIVHHNKHTAQSENERVVDSKP